MDYLYIDSFLHDPNWTLEITKLYKQAITNPNDIVKYESLEKQICKNESVNNGFLGDTKDMVYLRDEK